MKLKHFLKSIGNFLFSKANRELLIFFFFLIVSGAFWLIMATNETYEKELRLAVTCDGIPKNVVLTSPETDTVSVTVRDRGIILMTYLWGDALKALRFDFRSHTTSGETASIGGNELQALITAHLSASTKLLSVKPERLTFTYNYGERKRVPVRWRGRVTPDEHYFIASTYYSPDSVDIYASRHLLDSITTIYTEPLHYVQFHDTLSVSCHTERLRGVKVVPEEVSIQFVTDVLTEARIEGIPIVGVNMPEGIQLRTFPSKVAVRFITGINTLKTLTAADFEVVADYNELRASSSPKLDIYLRRMPDDITKVQLEQESVDYLLEKQSP